MLLLVTLQAEACKFSTSNTPPWVFFTFFKLRKWYQLRKACQSYLQLGVGRGLLVGAVVTQLLASEKNRLLQ